jgi:hypothetical protein
MVPSAVFFIIRLRLRSFLSTGNGDKDVSWDEIAEQSLKEFSRKVASSPTSVLEKLVADLSMEIDFVNEQVAIEPELYETLDAKKRKDLLLESTKKRLEIAEIEFRKRSSVF